MQASAQNNLTSNVHFRILLSEQGCLWEVRKQNNSYTKPSVPDYINKLVKFINERYFEKLTLTVCSEHVNVSPTHLENSFKKYTGQPKAKYVSAIRFKHAQRLLVTTSHPISKIAEEVGLEESQVLIRLFNKHLGITPLSYRKLRQ